jgi:hypothetical protein
VERRNQTGVEMARCMLKSMRVPSELWGEAVCTAVYVLNRCPTKCLNNKTPYEAWHGRKPTLSHLRTFGCVAHVKKVGPGLDKLSDRSRKLVFIGYESGTNGYRFLDPTTNKLVVSRDVIFEENVPWDWNNIDGNTDAVSDGFVVHYDTVDKNSTIEQLGEQPTTVDGQEGVVALNEVAPNSPNTPVSSQAQNQGWMTPPGQNSGSSEEGPVRLKTNRFI